jgi:hypothetical protein
LLLPFTAVILLGIQMQTLFQFNPFLLSLYS